MKDGASLLLECSGVNRNGERSSSTQRRRARRGKRRENQEEYDIKLTKSMKRILFVTISFAVISMLAQQGSTLRLTADRVSELAMRNITGTFSSGRIADVAVDPRNRSVWYVATGSGGLWKTTNHGISFQPVFDEGGAYSLGCVTVDPKNPDTVWLGTGENQAQRAIGYGDGVYKSTDAGKTWKNMGLANSEHIGKIWVDPRNPNVVWVASQGPLFSAGGDRGLYKTSDGGQTWKADAHDQREHGRDRFRLGSAQSGHHVRGGLPAAAAHQHRDRRRSGIGDV